MGTQVLHEMCGSELYHQSKTLRIVLVQSLAVVVSAQWMEIITWLVAEQVLPDTQHVAPVQPDPPHCAYLAAQLVPPPAALVVLADADVWEVESVVGAAVVEGTAAVPLGPEVAAQVDSQPAHAAPALLVDPPE